MKTSLDAETEAIRHRRTEDRLWMATGWKCDRQASEEVIRKEKQWIKTIIPE